MGFFVQVPPSASTAGDWTALKGWLTGILVLRGAYYSTDHNGADWLVQQLTSLCLGAAGCIHSRVLLVMPMAGGVETRGSPRLVSTDTCWPSPAKPQGMCQGMGMCMEGNI